MESKYNFSLKRTKVIQNEKIHPHHVVLHVLNPGGVECLPGQFAMLRLPDPLGKSFFLSRPFSIMKCTDTIEFLIKIVGKGTKLLSELNADARLEILFPLGTSFPDLERFYNPLLVAGGCGAAPILFVARVEAGKNRRPKVFYGARTKNDLVLKESLASVSSLNVSTEDGTEGFKGLVTGLLESEIKNETCDVIIACGPTPMLASIARLSQERKIECFVSIETMMGCGFGACLGCAVPKTGGGYLYACKDGPVLEARTIDWDEFNSDF